MRLPFDGKQHVSSWFGTRTYYNTDKKRMVTDNHAGWDMVPDTDTTGTVRALCDATVLAATRVYIGMTAEWGYYVKLWLTGYQHGAYDVFLCHNSKLLVKSGQKLKEGDAVSIYGGTGRTNSSYAKHLHLEVRKHGTTTAVSPSVLYPAITNKGAEKYFTQNEENKMEECTGKQLVVSGAKNCQYFGSANADDVLGTLAAGTYEVTALAATASSVQVGNVTLSGPWCKVLLDSKEVYCWALSDRAKVQDKPKTDTVTVTADKLNCRSAPGTTYMAVGQATKGAQLAIAERVVIANIQWGYVANQGWYCLQYTEAV